MTTIANDRSAPQREMDTAPTESVHSNPPGSRYAKGGSTDGGPDAPSSPLVSAEKPIGGLNSDCRQDLFDCGIFQFGFGGS